MCGAEGLLELLPSDSSNGISGGVVLPPSSCRAFKLMRGKAHLLSFSTTSSDKFTLHLAEPIICHNGLNAAGESRRVQPQETGEIVGLGWMMVVVIVLVLDDQLHQGILLLNQLGEFRRKVGSRGTSRRHLMFVEG